MCGPGDFVVCLEHERNTWDQLKEDGTWFRGGVYT